MLLKSFIDAVRLIYGVRSAGFEYIFHFKVYAPFFNLTNLSICKRTKINHW